MQKHQKIYLGLLILSYFIGVVTGVLIYSDLINAK